MLFLFFYQVSDIFFFDVSFSVTTLGIQADNKMVVEFRCSFTLNEDNIHQMESGGVIEFVSKDQVQSFKSTTSKIEGKEERSLSDDEQAATKKRSQLETEQEGLFSDDEEAATEEIEGQPVKKKSKVSSLESSSSSTFFKMPKSVDLSSGFDNEQPEEKQIKPLTSLDLSSPTKLPDETKTDEDEDSDDNDDE